MKTLLLAFVLLFSINLFSQQTNIIYFSIGITYQKNIENKVVKYINNNKDNFELVFVCPEQKIYVVRTKLNTMEFFKKIGNRFASTQFLFKEEKYITSSECLVEYNKLKANNFTN